MNILGDHVLAREKFLSMFGHMTGRSLKYLSLTPLSIKGHHVFPENHKFVTCAHGNLEDTREKAYVKTG